MSRGFGDLVVMLPLIYGMNQIDWTVEDNIFKVRIGYAVATAVTFLGWLYVAYLVQSTPNTKTIRVPKQPSFSAPSEGGYENMTIQDYDLSQVKKGFQQVAIGILIVGFVHWKWAIVQPLFMQCFLTPIQLYKNPIFKIYALGNKGDIEKRPFADENPFAAMMPTPPDTQTTETDEDESEQESTQASAQQRKKKTKKVQ
eukprot:TRINITY_DN2216_c0_g1_i1.p1 TRINITY_DN2216_c0_g1~~TRINITY_DN2216_c0_g1_i1.p1  ORF type:complete len:199 (+),score=55.32 TRINITY_DN2216_c0_g1_i1:105-701(+)